MVAPFSKFTVNFGLVFVLTLENAFSERFHFQANRRSIGSSKKLKTLVGKKSSYEGSFSNKTKICDFLIFAMSPRATFFGACTFVYHTP